MAEISPDIPRICYEGSADRCPLPSAITVPAARAEAMGAPGMPGSGRQEPLLTVLNQLMMEGDRL